MIEWYIGFYRPRVRNYFGSIYPMGWFGHVEIWGYTEDETWLFIDPQGTGTRVLVIHKYDDVMDQLNARFALCDSILRLPATNPKPMLPIHLFLNCASLVGHMVGVRAFTPGGLRRKLLAKGAEVIHENPEGRSGRQGSA